MNLPRNAERLYEIRYSYAPFDFSSDLINNGAVRKPTDPLRDMAEAYPQLLELYPFESFAARFLDVLGVLLAGQPGALYSSARRKCFTLRGKGVKTERWPPEAEAVLKEAENEGRGKLLSFGKGSAPALLGGAREAQLLPCAVLSRTMGYFILPPQTKITRKLSLLASLAGYYLHRDMIESAIEKKTGQSIVIMGRCATLFRLQEEAERVAPLKEPVLIMGETGSGKEILAQALHVLSPRNGGPFASVNCAASPSENLLLDEFFGHRKGSFTGALFDKEGCLRAADGGTLFLDEIGEMSHELQTLLLRTLTTGDVKSIGEDRPRRVDVRLICATHKDILDQIRTRAFREDLYYRISTFKIHIPPLRERREDIPYLAEYILGDFASRNGLPVKRCARAALKKLVAYPWPGNIRELENVLKRAYVKAEGDWIDVDALTLEGDEGESRREEALFETLRGGKGAFWQAVYKPFMNREMKRSELASLLEEAMAKAGGSLKGCAAYLKIPDKDYGRFVSFLHRHGFRGRRGSVVAHKRQKAEG